MSINYHAYQNKGYLLSVYEVVYKQWCEKFAGFDPRRAARILNLDYDKNFVYVNYYNQRFRLRLKDGVLEKEVKAGNSRSGKEIVRDGNSRSGKENVRDGNSPSGIENAGAGNKGSVNESAGTGSSGRANTRNKAVGLSQGYSPFAPSTMDLVVEELNRSGCDEGWTEDVFFNEGMAIYHYLGDVKNEPGRSGVLIPNASLDPRAVRKEDILGKDFASHFVGDCKGLEAACIALGGRAIDTKADVAYEFDAFPQIAVQVHYYDEDDDFPAQVQMMIDSQVTDYVHLECTGCFFSDIFERLIAVKESC